MCAMRMAHLAVVTSGEQNCALCFILYQLYTKAALAKVQVTTHSDSHSPVWVLLYITLVSTSLVSSSPSLGHLLFFATEFYHSATQLLRHHVLPSTHKGPNTAGKFAGTRLAWRSDVNVAVCTFRRNLNVKSIHIYIYIYIYMCVQKTR